MPTPALQTRYLDIGVVRIQEWLARTPDLRFRRGASTRLSELTSRARVEELTLPAGVGWTPDAGDLDGVVSLTVTAEPDRIDATGQEAAALVAAHLRAGMPMCHIEAATGTGSCYVEAYAEIAEHRHLGDLVLDSPPPAYELVAAKPCDQCRAAPAETAPISVHDEEVELCVDCAGRHDFAGGTKSGTGDAEPADPPLLPRLVPTRWGRPRPERRAIAALNAVDGWHVDDLQDDFEQLARWVADGQEKTDEGTQLATLYADGNAVGEFVAEAARHNGTQGWPARETIVRGLDAATLAALAAAVTQTLPNAPHPALLVHVAGGDDLLVSVPARYGWALARHLLAGFSTALAGNLIDPNVTGQRRATVAARLPSLSVGLVFHHHAEPFADVIDIAARELKNAKRQFRGSAAALAFADLTDDGYGPPDRAPVSLEDLAERAPTYGAVAAIPAAQRHTFRSLLRQHRRDLAQAAQGLQDADPVPGIPVPGAEQPEAGPLEALARRVPSLDPGLLRRVVTGLTEASPGQVRGAITSGDGWRRLEQVLEVARWWPPAARTAEMP